MPTAKRIFITGTAGFIGFHLARRLLEQGHRVFGYDALTDYYDVTLKERRHALLDGHDGFSATVARLEDMAALSGAVAQARPDVIVHLAAQAGVRYSLENPRAYVETNVTGTFNLLECARERGVDHLLLASTSSVYGANTEMPFAETDKADTQMTIYAATKKATESMGHAYAHLHGIPTTMFRFFTVYGSWGRPDMAPHRFASGIFAGRPIDIYNHGEMYRDFTHVGDLVEGIDRLIDAIPEGPAGRDSIAAGDSLSPVAPFRIVNIGNAGKVKLMDFVAALEEAAGRPAVKNFMEMQKGDVPATWADVSLLERLTGFRPNTDIRDGAAEFIAWYRDYYGV